MSAQINMIGVFVNNMKATLDFYRLLGFEIPDGKEDEAYVEINGAGVRFSFYLRKHLPDLLGEGADVEPVGHHFELAVKYESGEAVDKSYEKLVAAGVKSLAAPHDTPWGQHAAYVADPDGNAIDLFADELKPEDLPF